ncbi:TIM-barrel domain-containing protein [Granulicella sibirica]|uniref:glycoside hydrolase family 31 protein n=1 Tax=Granulicella sibirica TaxID=2479048 RepID=UPI0019D653A5|nr:TIM-barrel domain-containing protein [Granulicella sibirica]
MTRTSWGIQIATAECVLSLRPLTSSAMRIRCATADSHEDPSLVLTENVPTPPFRLLESRTTVTLTTEKMRAVYDRRTGALQFSDAAGRQFLSEIPGTRRLASSSIQGEPTFTAEQSFVSPKDEHLYGSGQFQDGYLDIRDLPRRLTQVNTQIAIPFLLSSKGYGILWHNYGLTDLNPADARIMLTPSTSGKVTTVDVTTTEGTKRQKMQEGEFLGKITVPRTGRYALMLDVGQAMAKRYHVEIDGHVEVDFANQWLPPTTSLLTNLSEGTHSIRVIGEQADKPVLSWRESEDRTVLRSPVAEAVDYVVFAGPTPNDVIATYRQLTGPAPLMPLWAYGYIHCRERFHSSQEILDTAAEFRRRNLPVDVLVQDWQYWGKYGWNAMKWDERYYPDPADMVSKLHAMNIKLMVSVWSKIDPDTEVGKEFAEKKYYVPNTQWVDLFNPAAAQLYWKKFSQRMLSLGIDAWWQDATEPENDDLVGRQTFAGPGEKVRLLFPLYVNKTVYEGQRKDAPEKRVFILTRSAFLGQQRYASATWSGDIGNSWDTLRRQITAGLDYSASGLPYWTTDAGGFFRPGESQYTDPAYHERLLRWFQFATFSPLQRVHGYQTDTEPWRFGDKTENGVRRFLDLRYQLMPYIYSEAAAVTFHGDTMMRPLVMDFSTDEEALNQKYEYMFGSSFLVAPVVQADVQRWQVYAPKTQGGWYDFWTGARVQSGTTTMIDAPIERLPLLVRAGSIVPLGHVSQYAAQTSNEVLEIRIYPGADGNFQLYEDEGTNYNYEHGAKSTIDFHWNDRASELSIGSRTGSFPGMLSSRTFKVLVIGSTAPRQVSYDGRKVSLTLGK